MANVIQSTHCETCVSHSEGIFYGISGEAQQELNSKKVLSTQKRGQTLFLQGAPALGLYCIKAGKIKISKVSGDGREIILRILGPHDVLGHQNLLSNLTHEVTAKVIEDATVCFFERKNILSIMDKHPMIALNIVRRLSEEMALFEAQTAAMSYKNVRERLAELLLNLLNTYGVSDRSRFRLDVKLTREEMASMVGTAVETVIRFISDFKEEGILEQDGKIIYIVDVERLRLTANH